MLSCVLSSSFKLPISPITSFLRFSNFYLCRPFTVFIFLKFLAACLAILVTVLICFMGMSFWHFFIVCRLYSLFSYNSLHGLDKSFPVTHLQGGACSCGAFLAPSPQVTAPLFSAWVTLAQLCPFQSLSGPSLPFAPIFLAGLSLDSPPTESPPYWACPGTPCALPVARLFQRQRLPIEHTSPHLRNLA